MTAVRQLNFSDLCFKSQHKEILKHVSGSASSGDMLTVMGPSGSGKTTLLHSIAGKVSVTSGDITLNGSPFNKQQRRHLGYVMQEDVFLPNLTLWETLYFSAMMRVSDTFSKQEKLDRIEKIVTTLDLQHCINTVIGDAFQRGLSGGERKRTHIACELLTDPDILLIDEPTSGLDSSSAHRLMGQLKKYASEYNKILMVTIHQPSSKIYHMFSTLLLLAEGQRVYYGVAAEATVYFSSLGFTYNPRYNPADYLPFVLEEKETNRWPTSSWNQLKLLNWRSYKQAKGRIFQRYDIIHAAVLAVIFGMLYFQIENSEKTLRDKMGMVTCSFLHWGLQISFSTILGHSTDRGVVWKERTVGAYRLSIFYVSRLTTELPLLLVIPTIFNTVLYWAAGLGGLDGYFVFCGIGILNGLLVQSLASVVGICFVNLKLCFRFMDVILLGGLLIGGFFNTHPPSWLSWSKYLSISHYPYAASVSYLLKDMDPLPCNQTSLTQYPRCRNNAADLVTSHDVLANVGIDLPIYCYIATIVSATFLLHLMGYCVLRWKRYTT
ncbi:uncharacterized protein LOC132555551 [Ylistrum balloti]|uniref:uncharacterized protein LOC132555551 n=1 Tax=Ylistrum balloti TaxID=509963 RepID=UPI002905BE05|nr:uncharacterized protein LOC132555551 [Ylistrum balloti]